MRQHILLIDDTKQIHSLVAGLLSTEPCELHFAGDGTQGITLAESIHPDLILLDVEMPGMDGYATCRLLKGDPNLFNIPVVFLTSCSTTDEKVHGLNLGAVDYITKPFSPSELLARVRATLRTSRAIKMLEEHARIDFLTGLGNRAMFKERLAAEVSLRVRTKKPLACVVVDIDNFQAINDTQGHPFADTVLQRIAEVLKDLVRVEDVPCRLGGDAFAIITPNTETEDACLLADRISRDLKQLKFTHRDEPVEVACNVGVGPAIDTYDRAMHERALAAIQEAKALGSKEVTLANHEEVLIHALGDGD
jgi:diguanylate cyclase (GGDEF)-like protein